VTDATGRAADDGVVTSAVDALDALSTEGARPELADLDLWPTLDAVKLFADDHRAVVDAVRAAEGAIASAIEFIAGRMELGGRLIYVGAGTGGRMAAVDAAEIGPTYGLHGRVVAVLAGGLDAFVEGSESHEDLADAGTADVAAVAPGAQDVVLGVSASGRTPYVLGGIGAGRACGALTIGFACTTGSPLARSSDLAIEVTTGPEIIAGSTRLKAGTAQKMVLNAISTLVMVRLGRTYGNLMVNVAADNTKLQRRAVRAVVQATGANVDRAAAALGEAGGEAEVAVVALLAGVPVARARELLGLTSGRVRNAVMLADTQR
jgi:N-acetylmuramic acid 6-phosphate etherase